MQSTTSTRRQQDAKPRAAATPKDAQKAVTDQGATTRTGVNDQPKSILERLKAYVDLKFPATLNELPHIRDEAERREVEQEQLQEMMTFFLDQFDFEDSVQFMQLSFQNLRRMRMKKGGVDPGPIDREPEISKLI